MLLTLIAVSIVALSIIPCVIFFMIVTRQCRFGFHAGYIENGKFICTRCNFKESYE